MSEVESLYVIIHHCHCVLSTCEIGWSCGTESDKTEYVANLVHSQTTPTSTKASMYAHMCVCVSTYSTSVISSADLSTILSKCMTSLSLCRKAQDTACMQTPDNIAHTRVLCIRQLSIPPPIFTLCCWTHLLFSTCELREWVTWLITMPCLV